jgi:predicted nucleic acid-binding protein
MKSFIVDACVWLEYLKENKAVKELIEENNLKTSAVAVAEIAKILFRDGTRPELVKKSVEVIARKSGILELDLETAAKAGEIAVKEKMPLIDAIMYAYATPEDFVLTADDDFENKPFVKLVKLAK